MGLKSALLASTIAIAALAPSLILFDLNNHTYKFVDLATYASTTATGWAKRVPDQTTGVSASQGTQYGKVNVIWNATSLATGYDIYRSTSSGKKAT